MGRPVVGNRGWKPLPQLLVISASSFARLPKTFVGSRSAREIQAFQIDLPNFLMFIKRM
jgi:hypothetical protein